MECEKCFYHASVRVFVVRLDVNSGRGAKPRNASSTTPTALTSTPTAGGVASLIFGPFYADKTRRAPPTEWPRNGLPRRHVSPTANSRTFRRPPSASPRWRNSVVFFLFLLLPVTSGVSSE